MIFPVGTKMVGEQYDEGLQLYLDLPAERQLYPLWWKDHPRAYERLVELRKEKGIEVEDDLLIAPEDLGDDMLSNEELLKAADDD